MSGNEPPPSGRVLSRQFGGSSGGPPLQKQPPPVPAQLQFPPQMPLYAPPVSFLPLPPTPPVHLRQPPHVQSMPRPQQQTPGLEPDPEPTQLEPTVQLTPVPHDQPPPPPFGPRVHEPRRPPPPPGPQEQQQQQQPQPPPPQPSHKPPPWHLQPPSHKPPPRQRWLEPEGLPPAAPAGANLSTGPCVASMSNSLVFELPQGLVLRNLLPGGTALGGLAMHCACDDHEFVMVYPETYIGGHSLHAIIHIAGCDGDEFVTSRNMPAEAVQSLFHDFAWLFFVGAGVSVQQWREPPNFWMLDVAQRLSPSFASMGLMGFARGASWASLLARLRPRMFRCVILLGGYPSPGTIDIQQQQEAAALCAAVAEVMVVASDGDSLSPPDACRAWLRTLQSNGAEIVVHETWTHDSLRTMFVHGHHDVQDSIAEQTLRRIHAMLYNI